MLFENSRALRRLTLKPVSRPSTSLGNISSRSFNSSKLTVRLPTVENEISFANPSVRLLTDLSPRSPPLSTFNKINPNRTLTKFQEKTRKFSNWTRENLNKVSIIRMPLPFSDFKELDQLRASSRAKNKPRRHRKL